MLIGTDKGSILCVCWGPSIKGHLGISDTQATKIQYMVPWEWGHTAYFNYFSLEIGVMLLASSNHHLSPIYVTLWQGICMINKLCCNKWTKERTNESMNLWTQTSRNKYITVKITEKVLVVIVQAVIIIKWKESIFLLAWSKRVVKG